MIRKVEGFEEVEGEGETGLLLKENEQKAQRGRRDSTACLVHGKKRKSNERALV